MAGKRDEPENVVLKLRQVEMLQGQGTGIADAVRQIGANSISPISSVCSASRGPWSARSHGPDRGMAPRSTGELCVQAPSVCQTPGYETRSRVDDPANPASRPCRRLCPQVSRRVAPSYGFGRRGRAETRCLTSLAPRRTGGCPQNGRTGRRRAWTHCPRHPAAVIHRPPDPSREALSPASQAAFPRPELCGGTAPSGSGVT